MHATKNMFYPPISLEMQVAPTSAGTTPVLDEAGVRKPLTAVKAAPPVPSKAAVAAVARPSVAGGPLPKCAALPNQPCSPRGPPPKRPEPFENTAAKIARLTGPEVTPKKSSPVNRNLDGDFQAVSGEKNSGSSLIFPTCKGNPASKAMTGHDNIPPKAPTPIVPSTSPSLTPTVLESSHFPSEAVDVLKGEAKKHLFCFFLFVCTCIQTLTFAMLFHDHKDGDRKMERLLAIIHDQQKKIDELTSRVPAPAPPAEATNNQAAPKVLELNQIN